MLPENAKETTSIARLLRNVVTGEETIFDVGEGKLAVSIQRKQAEAPRPPVRVESKAREHRFHSAESLRDYLAKFGTTDTVVFADVANETIHATLSEGASAGREIVSMRPVIHPLWQPWQNIIGTPMTIETFAQFIAERRRSVLKPNGKELALMLSQIRATVSIEIQKGRGRKAINGLVVTSEIQGTQTKENVDLPDEIIVRAPLFVQTEPLDVELDLCIEAKGEDVTVLVSEGTVAEARVTAFERMFAAIREGLPQGAICTFGAPSQRDWLYLPERP